MFIPRLALVGASTLALTFSSSFTARAQDAAPPHTIVIRLTDDGGPQPYGFEPGVISARRGDTLRFVQAGSTMHNVHFVSVPKGAKLGNLATSDYLTTKGQAFTVVLDSRFPDGRYEIVCDPHLAVGMRAILTVSGGKE
ncbi:MAG TPA: plastocyanin/azurin family copper-binding protein [Gemmatimonadaceae bacterium]|nr:plastocyanin/azurin family copper-binding protein [Gemmatimonadaceae bacterium]